MQLLEHQIQFLKKFLYRLKEREFLISTFNIIKDRPVLIISDSDIVDFYKNLNSNQEITILNNNYKEGNIYLFNYNNNSFYVYIDRIEDNNSIIKLLSKDTSISPLAIDKVFTITKDFMVNFNREPELTSIGRVILNQLLLVEAFNDYIPYVNEDWDQSKIEQIVADGLLEGSISKEQHKTFINLSYFLGHFTQLSVPTLTRRALTTSPKVKIRKKELLEQYKDQLTDPSIIQLIEGELLALDKEWLGEDLSTIFYEGVGKKAYGVHRKKLFLAVGGIEEFDDKSGKYTFIKNSLSEGLTTEAFPTVCNEIIKGSYARGKETAKGGEFTLYMARVFQTLTTIEDDCGAIRGLPTKLTKNNINEFIGRAILTDNEGSYIVLNKNNLNDYIDKIVNIRSPKYCKSKSGFCYLCLGQRFKTLNTQALGMIPIDISSTLLSASMAAMHGTKIDTIPIDYTKYFV